MASGIFSTSTLGTDWSLVAAGAATANRMVTVSVTSLGALGQLAPFPKFSLAIVPKGNLTAADKEYIEYDSAILPGSVLEKTSILISPDYDLIAKADTIASIQCVSYGVEIKPAGSTYVLEQTDITAAGPITISADPGAGYLKVVTITVVNRDIIPCTIDVGYSDGVTTTYIEKNTVLSDDGILERTGLILAPTYSIVIDATTTGTLAVSASSYGITNLI